MAATTTVSQSTKAPTHELFRSRNATLCYRARANKVVCVLKTASSEGAGRMLMSGSSQESYDHTVPSLLRKPVVASSQSDYDDHDHDNDKKSSEEKEESNVESDDDKWENWEDRILEETVPLVAFVRTVLHSGKYEIGDRLRPEHQNIILERLLPYHPEYEAKIGSGVESITIGFHTEFKRTRCLFIVRNDGEVIDFSYWKCIKGLIRKKYPLFADAFILRHFRQRRHNTKIKKI